MNMTVEKKEQNQNKNKFYFLGVPFKDGDVYKYLSQEKSNFIVGMDIGDGECVIYFYDPKRMDASGVVEAIRVYFDNGGKIQSMLSVDDEGNVHIGSSVKDRNSFYHQFKVPPTKWDEKLGGKKKGELTELFIRKLWTLIKNNSNEVRVAFGNDKLMIAVGCPADNEWMSESSMNAYKQLIERATGCKKVAIVPESTAAAMTAVMPNGKVNSDFLTKGIAVIDIGSSTIDFTYMHFGKALITRSEHIAGSDIDYQMLRVALEKDPNRYVLESEADLDSDIDLDKIIDHDEENQLLVELRLLKEKFYSEGCKILPSTVYLFKRDENGNIISGKNSKFKTVQIVVDSNFMETALTKAYGKRSDRSNSKSWLTIMNEFISNTSDRIPRDKNGKIECDKVIVTGGTGNVTQIQDIIESVYGKDIVTRSEDSSTGVAQGLCYSKAIEIKAANAIESYKKSVEDIGKKYADKFTDEVVKEAARSQYDVVKKTAQMYLNSGKEPTIREFANNVVAANAQKKYTIDEKKIEEIYMRCLDDAAIELTSIVDKLSESLYKVKIDNKTTILSMVNDSLDAVKIDKLIDGIFGKNAAIQMVMKLISKAFYAAAAMALFPAFYLAVPLFVLGMIFGSTNVQNQVGNWTVIQNRKIAKNILEKIISQVENPKQLESAIEKSLENKSQILKDNNNMQETFVKSVNEVAEICLGKVLMLVFDECE